MSYDLIIAIAIGVLTVSVLWLRTNIALGILALTAGYVVSDLVSADLYKLFADNGIDVVSIPLESIISISIILAPSFLVMLRFKNFQPGRLIIHLAPAFSYALLAVMFILISLPVDTQAMLREESFAYTQFEYFQAVVVIGAVVIAIFDLMAHERKLRRKSKHRKRGVED